LDSLLKHLTVWNDGEAKKLLEEQARLKKLLHPLQLITKELTDFQEFLGKLT
jgi:hypothetical protein